MKRVNRTLPVLGGLAILGAAAGVTLGQNAVAEINPLYFGSAPDRFHADQVPQRPNWTAPQPVQYSAATAADGLGNGCFGCGGERVEYYAAPAITTYTDSWAADAERASAPVEPAYVEQAVPDPERDRVVRYAIYQSTASQPAAEAQPAQAEAAPPADAAAGEPTAL
jgi:hypothetical protein